MAKKLLYNRAVASKVYWPAVFEDISDDEDTSDFQPLDYSTSPKFKYQGSVTSADSTFLPDLSRKTEENVNIKVEKDLLVLRDQNCTPILSFSSPAIKIVAM